MVTDQYFWDKELVKISLVKILSRSHEDVIFLYNIVDIIIAEQLVGISIIWSMYLMFQRGCEYIYYELMLNNMIRVCENIGHN